MLNKQDQIQQLIGGLERASWDSARQASAMRKARIGIFIAGVWLLSALILLVIDDLQKGGWYYFNIVGVVLTAIGIVFSGRLLWKQIQRLHASASPLREAAAERDEQQAPLAAEQPAPLTAAEFPMGAERLGLFGNWRNSLAGGIALIILLLLPGGGFAALLVALLENNVFDHLALAFAVTLGVLLFLLGLAALLSSIVGLIALFMLSTARRHAYIGADESGVRWWRKAWGKHSRLSISWYEARSFFMIAYAGEKEGTWRRVYALDTPDTILMWYVNEKTGAQQMAAHERFCRLIVKRTKLPLRDLSAAVEKLVSIDEPSIDNQSPALASIPAEDD